MPRKIAIRVVRVHRVDPPHWWWRWSPIVRLDDDPATDFHLAGYPFRWLAVLAAKVWADEVGLTRG